MHPTMNVRALIPGLLIALLSLNSCAATATQAVIALPNGYYLQPNKAGGLSLAKRRGGAMVRESIAAYAVVRQVVTGALGEPPPLHRYYTNDLPFKGTADTRYFVLDTTSGKLDTGLDEAAWKARVAALGLPPTIELHAPIFPE
jgi:hypothetical protein